MTRMGVHMNSKLTGVVSAAVLLAATVQSASALPARLGLGFGASGDVPVAGHLVEGRFTMPPAAFVEYCNNWSSQCDGGGGGQPMALDGDRWEELRRVNASVNGRIQPKADPAHEDHWTLGADAGDCDEYAVQKRQALADRGWPASALTLTVARLSNGDGHLVLVVRTDRGEFVLDNLRQDVVAADRANYRWLMRQSAMHPKLWVRVNGSAHESIDVARLRREEQPVAATPAAMRADPADVTGATPKASVRSDSQSTLMNYLLNR